MTRQFILNLSLLLLLANSIQAQNSVLENGRWAKLAITENNVYKITYEDIVNLGIDPSDVSPSKIKIYGNGAGMLPQDNDSSRIYDLQEIAILVITQSANAFKQGDYILFYSEGPDYITFDKTKDAFFYQNHLFTNTNYYFLTLDGNDGLRVSQGSVSIGGPELKSGITYSIHEQDLYNILHSGRFWYGEKFDLNTSQKFDTDIVEIEPGSDLKLISSVMSSSTETSNFSINLNNSLLGSQDLLANPGGTYGRKGITAIDTLIMNESMIDDNPIEVQYNFNKSSGIGYLDYFILQAEIPLNYSGEPLSLYTGSESQTENRTVVIENCPPDLIVWDVSNPAITIQYDIIISEGVGRFNIDNTVESVILFTPAAIPLIEESELVVNQNIKGVTQADLLIISPPEFINAANEISNLRLEEGIISVVVTDQEIYNEFSSGKKDISALRDYIKFLYDNAGLKYVLLLGKGTYDPKDIVESGLEKIPIYQSRNSLFPLGTYSSDDFLGFLEDHEGDWDEDNSNDHTMDVGVGRVPVTTIEEAELYVNKLKAYSSKAALGKWRQNVVFVAENGDGNIHQRDAERLATLIDTTYANFTTKKIYVDAYPIEIKPGGHKAPEANLDIYDEINAGALIVNYTGHGDDTQWANTRIFDTKVIDSLLNDTFLPLFVTATCEFGRHDDTGNKSGGEELLLMKETGAIATITTARPVFASSNYQLNLAFYNAVFEQVNGKYQHLGEIFKQTKNNSLNGVQNRNFSLLGDPSMTLTYGEQSISLDSLNGKLITESDTLKAQKLLEFSGSIRKHDQSIDQNFNGKVDVKILDKEQSRTTLGNLGESPFKYKVRNNVLFNGSATITNGSFNYSTVLPSDISYNPASGRVVMYAYEADSLVDASGANIDFLIGNSPTDPITDNDDPVVDIFIGDSTFTNGSIVNENSLLIVRLEDDYGINTSSGQVGHSITYQLDNDEPVILNEYYSSEQDEFRVGWIYYNLPQLSPGEHVLKVKAWDTSNNSGISEVQFSVSQENQVTITDLSNYPNPVQGQTSFTFKHNLGGEDLTVQLEILNTSGQKVYSETRNYDSAPSTIDNWDWDGRNSSGGKLNEGIYIFGIYIRSNSNDLVQNQYSRLFITN